MLNRCVVRVHVLLCDGSRVGQQDKLVLGLSIRIALMKEFTNLVALLNKCVKNALMFGGPR